MPSSAHNGSHLRACACAQSGSSDEDIIDDNLGFSKERCISRLVEMQSLEYLIRHAKRHSPSLLLALEEAQQRTAGEN